MKINKFISTILLTTVGLSTLVYDPYLSSVSAARTNIITSEKTVNLFTWWSPARGDNFATTKREWAGRPGDRRTDHDGYGFVSVVGSVFNPSKPRPSGTIPLYGWWSPSRKDNFITANPAWAGRPGVRKSPDYGFVRVEGYIYPPSKPQPSGTIPLYTWWSRARGDYFATTQWAGRPGDRIIDHDGYEFVRLEGYILKPNR
jgi:hypothetical protein